jgi:hypothetical protein
MEIRRTFSSRTMYSFFVSLILIVFFMNTLRNRSLMQNLKQREVRAPSSSSSLSNTNDWHSAADAEIRTSTISKSAVIQKQTLPIYLLQPNKESAFQTTWGKLATEWNRTTTYTDLINLAKPMASLPNSFKKSRSLVMIHCAPKNGRCVQLNDTFLSIFVNTT